MSSSIVKAETCLVACAFYSISATKQAVMQVGRRPDQIDLGANRRM